MTFIRPQQDLVSPKLTEQFYRGIVVDNLDPSQLGRIKVRILELHGTVDEISDSNLPWAMQMRPCFLGGASDLSTFSVPRVDSEVIITHIKGDIYQPAYIFELSSKSTEIQEAKEDYPDSYGFKDSDGNKYHVNMVQDTLTILFNGDQKIEITNDRETLIGNDDIIQVTNNKTETIGNDRTNTVSNNEVNNISNNQTNTIGSNKTDNITGSHSSTVGGSFTINVTGSCNITSGGNASITAPQILLNGPGAGVLTQESINPLTGSPFPDGSSTVKAGQG